MRQRPSLSLNSDDLESERRSDFRGSDGQREQGSGEVLTRTILQEELHGLKLALTEGIAELRSRIIQVETSVTRVQYQNASGRQPSSSISLAAPERHHDECVSLPSQPHSPSGTRDGSRSPHRRNTILSTMLSPTNSEVIDEKRSSSRKLSKQNSMLNRMVTPNRSDAVEEKHSRQPSKQFENRRQAAARIPTKKPGALMSGGAMDEDAEEELELLLSEATSEDDMKPPDSVPSSIVLEKSFDMTMGCVIFSNAVLIGFEADYHARNIGSDSPMIFQLLEDMYCLVFAAELLLRLQFYGRNFWCSQDWAWNIFDFIVVVLQIIDVFSQTFIKSISQGVDLSFLRVMRLVRLLRIVRLARLLKLVGELRTMIKSIAGSMKALGWAISILCMLIYGVGVFLTQFVTEQRNKYHKQDENNDSLEILDRYYGTLPTTLLYLWASISGGMDWIDMMGPLLTDVSPLVAFAFLSYIAFCVLSILNIVTGICVDQARKSATKDQDSEIARNVTNLFKKDPTGRKEMSWEDFRSELASPEVQEFLRTLDVDDSEAPRLFELMDIDGSGTVSPDEFMSSWVRLRGPAKSLDLACLMLEHNRAISDILDRMQDIDSFLTSRLTALNDFLGLP